MKNGRLYVGILGIIIMFLCAYCDGPSTEAQAPSEVKPYAFADIPGGEVYKLVHEGCELYIVLDSAYNNPSVSITTGHGCK